MTVKKFVQEKPKNIDTNFLLQWLLKAGFRILVALLVFILVPHVLLRL